MKKTRKEKTLSVKELQGLLKKSKNVRQNMSKSFFTEDAIRIIQDSSIQNMGKAEIPQIEMGVHLFLQHNGISNSVAIIVLSNLLSSYMLNNNNTLTDTSSYHNPSIH